MSTYLYGAFDCMFLLSCHVRVSEWIHTLQLPECKGTPCSKQERYLKFVYELSGCGTQVTKWHSGNHRVWIHSEIRTWHDKNLQYSSCFAVVLRGIHGNVDICQTDYNITSKLKFSPYSEIIHGCTTFKLIKS